MAGEIEILVNGMRRKVPRIPSRVDFSAGNVFHPPFRVKMNLMRAADQSDLFGLNSRIADPCADLQGIAREGGRMKIARRTGGSANS